eukprot:5392339-Alexandrium_andersonii.AAC.1
MPVELQPVTDLVGAADVVLREPVNPGVRGRNPDLHAHALGLVLGVCVCARVGLAVDRGRVVSWLNQLALLRPGPALGDPRAAPGARQGNACPGAKPEPLRSGKRGADALDG